MMKPYKGKVYYGWVIVAASFFVIGGSIGIVWNCASQFIKPVSLDWGLPRSSVALCQTIVGGVNMAVVLFSGWIFAHFNMRRLMQIAAIVMSGSYFLLSLCPNIYVMYALFVVVGLSYALLSNATISIILSNWFKARRGFAMGLAFMGSGILGMVVNSLAGGWIESMGWRSTYQLLSLFVAICTIPACFLIIRIRPQDMGLDPYGEVHDASGHAVPEEGYSFKQAKKMPRFWLLCVLSLLYCMAGNTTVQLISPHLSDLGYEATFAANILALAMGAIAFGKIMLGTLYDRIGAKRGTVVSGLFLMTSLIGMLLCRQTVGIVLIVLGAGLGNAFGTVGPPALITTVMGRKYYSQLIGIPIAFGSLAGMITPLLNNAVYDLFKSYAPSLYVMVGVGLVCIFGFTLVVKDFDPEKALSEPACTPPEAGG